MSKTVIQQFFTDHLTEPFFFQINNNKKKEIVCMHTYAHYSTKYCHFISLIFLPHLPITSFAYYLQLRTLEDQNFSSPLSLHQGPRGDKRQRNKGEADIKKGAK